MTENLPLEFLQECRDCVGRMRPSIVVEQNDPMGELPWSLRFNHLAKDGQGFQVMLGIHLYPALQEVYQKGAILYVYLRFEGTSTSQVIGARNE